MEYKIDRQLQRKRGIDFENRVKAYLRSLGYVVPDKETWFPDLDVYDGSFLFHVECKHFTEGGSYQASREARVRAAGRQERKKVEERGLERKHILLAYNNEEDKIRFKILSDPSKLCAWSKKMIPRLESGTKKEG